MATPADSTPASANATLTPAEQARAVDIGNLHNKVALITGASSGLGRAIAQAYAAAGAYVVNADLRPNPPSAPLLASQPNFKSVDLTTATVDLINAQYPSTTNSTPRASFVQCNVTDPDSVAAAVSFTARVYSRLDIMVNNAGISTSSSNNGAYMRTHEQDISQLDADLSVNVRGVWLGCKHALAQMLSQPPLHPSADRGWIINMCSIAGLIGFRAASTYCATKGAVLQMTKAIALEYAPDRIHVNCINPGFAETSLLERLRGRGGDDEESRGGGIKAIEDMHPWGRLAMPEDVAKMAVFLAGEGASFCTGAAFVVDGGFTAQ